MSTKYMLFFQQTGVLRDYYRELRNYYHGLGIYYRGIFDTADSALDR